MTNQTVTVGLVTTRFVRQGPNRQLLYLIRKLDRQKIRPIVITLSNERDPSLLSEFKNEDVPIVQLNLSMVKSLVAGAREISRIVKQFRIDILHSFTYAVRVELILNGVKDIPKIASIRNSPQHSSSGYFGRFAGMAAFRLKQHLYHNYDLLIPCSNSINSLPELSPYKRTAIVNGIDTDQSLLFTDRTKSAIRDRLNLPQKTTVFVTVSNGTSIKNIEFLISFFLKQSNAMLVVAGNVTPEYTRMTANNPRICFTGHVDNILAYYYAADFFISASYLEGMPNAVLESLLVGTPCILSDIPMHREICELSDTPVARLFKNNDSTDLQTQISAFRKLLSPQTAEMCTRHVMTHFSAERMAREHERVYASILHSDEQQSGTTNPIHDR